MSGRTVLDNCDFRPGVELQLSGKALLDNCGFNTGLEGQLCGPVVSRQLRRYQGGDVQLSEKACGSYHHALIVIVQRSFFGQLRFSQRTGYCNCPRELAVDNSRFRKSFETQLSGKMFLDNCGFQPGSEVQLSENLVLDN